SPGGRTAAAPQGRRLCLRLAGGRPGRRPRRLGRALRRRHSRPRPAGEERARYPPGLARRGPWAAGVDPDRPGQLERPHRRPRGRCRRLPGQTLPSGRTDIAPESPDPPQPRRRRGARAAGQRPGARRGAPVRGGTRRGGGPHRRRVRPAALFHAQSRAGAVEMAARRTPLQPRRGAQQQRHRGAYQPSAGQTGAGHHRDPARPGLCVSRARALIPGPSLKRHLSLAILVVLTLLGIAIASGANLLFDRLEARVSEARVSSASERLLGAIRQGQSGPYLDPSRLDPEFNRPLSGQYFVVTVGEQRWRSRSLWDSELPTVSGKRPGAFVRAPGPGGQQLLLLTRVFERFGQGFTITVASDYGPLVAEFRRGLYLFIGLWGLALAASLLALNLWLN